MNFSPAIICSLLALAVCAGAVGVGCASSSSSSSASKPSNPWVDQKAKSPLKPAGDKPFMDLNKNGKMDPYEDTNLAIERRIDDLLSKMTVEEKTCQLATLY